MIKIALKKGHTHSGRSECSDCAHLQASVSWWCKSKEAIDFNGTSMGSFHSCKFWKPCLRYDDLSFIKKILITLNLNYLMCSSKKLDD